MGTSNLNFYAGTSNIVLPFPKYLFPDVHRDKSRLAFYATLYNSVEVNSSFYKIPKPSTTLRWASEVTSSFKFTFKLWKGITHNKWLDFKQEDVLLFIKAINIPAHNKGCILIQLPPSTGVSQHSQLNKLLNIIHELNFEWQWRIAVEFRNTSWYCDDVYETLHLYNAGIVMHDFPATRPPVLDQLNSFVYVRFHGPDGNYKGSYTDEFLHEYALYIDDWMNEGKQVYTYFNNTAGDALNNLNSLIKEVEEIKIP